MGLRGTRYIGPLLLVTFTVVAVPDPLHADQRGDAKAQVAFGIKVAQAGLWKEAQFRFDRAVQLDPTYAAAWNDLAIVYEQLGEHDKAKRAYGQALKLAPKNTFVRDNYDLFKEIHARMTKSPCARHPC